MIGRIQGNGVKTAMMALLGLAIAACAVPDTMAVEAPGQPAAWRPVDASTGQIADIAGLEGLADAFPDSGSVRLRLLNAHLQAEDLAGAYDAIATLHARGYRLGMGAREHLLATYQGVEREKIAEMFANEPARVEASEPVTTVPASAHLVESLAFDPAGNTLYATTVVSQALYARAGQGEWRAVDLPDAAALTGILHDPATGYVWAASGDPMLGPEPVPGFRGLIAYDPASGGVAHRIAAPAGSNPSDMTLGPDGTLYVSDPLSGVIYRAARDAEALGVLIPAGTFRSPQGLAVSAEGRFLYLSDYRYGLALVDLETGTVERLAAVSSYYLDGIDGLWLHRDALIAVQNGSSPMRILRLSLASDGRSITESRIVEQAHSGWTEPLGGTIAGDSLLYVANGQWDRFIEGGAPDPGNPPGPTQIRALRLVEKPVPPPA